MATVDVRVRRCGPADVRVLAGMRRAWAEEQAGQAIADDGFEARFGAWFETEADHRVTWLAELGERPVGMLNLLVFTRMPRPRHPNDKPAQWGYVANVYVDRARRDAGVGRVLLAAATSYADETGLARLVLSPSERSVPFYERAGFTTDTTLMVRHVR